MRGCRRECVFVSDVQPHNSRRCQLFPVLVGTGMRQWLLECCGALSQIRRGVGGPRLHPKINARAENFSFQGTISNRASLEVCLANFSRRSRTKKGGQPSIGFLAPPLLPIGAKDGLFPYPALIGRAAGILRRDRCSSLISPPGQKTGTENESRRTCAFECSDGPSAGH